VFDLGPYSDFIWPAYAISSVALGGLTLWTLAAWQRAWRRLTDIEKTAREEKQ
jgi:heme exporter protein CcmD